MKITKTIANFSPLFRFQFNSANKKILARISLVFHVKIIRVSEPQVICLLLYRAKFVKIANKYRKICDENSFRLFQIEIQENAR